MNTTEIKNNRPKNDYSAKKTVAPSFSSEKKKCTVKKSDGTYCANTMYKESDKYCGIHDYYHKKKEGNLKDIKKKCSMTNSSDVPCGNYTCNEYPEYCKVHGDALSSFRKKRKLNEITESDTESDNGSDTESETEDINPPVKRQKTFKEMDVFEALDGIKEKIKTGNDVIKEIKKSVDSKSNLMDENRGLRKKIRELTERNKVTDNDLKSKIKKFNDEIKELTKHNEVIKNGERIRMQEYGNLREEVKKLKEENKTLLDKQVTAYKLEQTRIVQIKSLVERNKGLEQKYNTDLANYNRLKEENQTLRKSFSILNNNGKSV